jgi:hypothetical protein
MRSRSIREQKQSVLIEALLAMGIEVTSAMRISDIEDRALRAAGSASYARHFASTVVLRNWRWGTNYGYSRL